MPDIYSDDDTPRKFKDLMKSPSSPSSAPKKKATMQDTPKADDQWTVRPGETFRDFNARIRLAGLSLPPGVPEAFRGAPGKKRPSDVPPPLPPPATKPLPKFTDEEGSKTRKRRKEYLKQRKAVKKSKEHDSSDLEEYEGRRNFRDVVQAPPVLKVTPRETLKMKEKPSKLKKNPSLLPFLKRQHE